MAYKLQVGDVLHHKNGTYFKVLEILDKDYCICYMREIVWAGHYYGNWKQPIANIQSAVRYKQMRLLSPAEVVLFDEV